MKFLLVDRIESIEPSKRIVTTKALTLAEEYLADHFPAFPVMPGVLMLEALVQSAAWLVRLEQNFAKSVIVLASARNVRYANFVQPGRKLRCELDAVSIDADSAKFKGIGWIDDNQALSARLELKCLNLSDRGGYLAEADASIISDLKKQFELVGGPSAMSASDG
ncbi:MAG: 3-hydroxyacyl-ACP dehydratase FabZ family protein [Phycisphaerae bacterium]|jgi:3-hydroxyacyl-[acyl-carrier-protein] dehydratase|nr:3-hydroxyacyl-ACP dehydratase FabZ family protein [Phycisphaerae bacterium]